MAAGAVAVMIDEELQREAKIRWIVQISYEDNYDIGLGMLDYPEPRTLIFRLKEQFRNFIKGDN